MKRAWLLFWVCWLVVPPWGLPDAWGQAATAETVPPYLFRHLDNSDGLVDNQVNAILRDSHHFLWFATSTGLSRWDGSRFRNYSAYREGSVHLGNRLYSIQEDGYDNLWFAIDNSQMLLYNTSTEVFQQEPLAGIRKTYIDPQKKVWLITTDNTLAVYQQPEQKIVTVPFKSDQRTQSRLSSIKGSGSDYWVIYTNGVLESFDTRTGDVLFRTSFLQKAAPTQDRETFPSQDDELELFIDSRGDIWVYNLYTGMGLWRFQRATQTWTQYHTGAPLPMRLSVNEVRVVEEDNEGNIWVGTDHGGICIIPAAGAPVQTIASTRQDERGLSDNSILALHKDQEGIMWIGTHKKGVNYYHKNLFKFAVQTPLPVSDCKCFAEDKDGRLWIGTNGNGLLLYDPNTEQVLKRYIHNPDDPSSISSDIIVSLFIDSDNLLWIGTWLGGLNCFNGTRFTHYVHDPSSTASLPDNSVWSMVEDPKGKLWITTYKGGICLFDKATRRFIPLQSYTGISDIAQSSFSTTLIKDDNGRILTNINQYFCAINPNTFVIDTLALSKKDPSLSGISNFSINDILLDNRHLLWMATDNGLDVYDIANDSLYVFYQEDGLACNTLRLLIQDKNNDVWVGGSSGLTRVSVSPQAQNTFRFSFLSFSQADGLASDEFNQDAAICTRQGRLLFGGPDGLSVFREGTLSDPGHIPYLVFTDLLISGKRVFLPRSISRTSALSFHPTEKDFTLVFSGINYLSNQPLRYRYRLLGFTPDWIEAQELNPRVAYTNLPTGKYTLQIATLNNNGMWSQQPLEMHITMLPTFWERPAAIIMYILLGLALGGFIYYLVRKRLRAVARRQQLENEQQMAQTKLQFFANVSHEFRTPLSLILAPCEMMMNEDPSPQLSKRLTGIMDNAHHLLEMVDELLDYKKMDDGTLPLELSHWDMVQFVKSVMEPFKEAAAKKKIDLSFASDVPSLLMEFDKNKMQKIISNLLSNALKFTLDNGAITVSLGATETNAVLKVTDSGVGIRAQDVSHIFERFYQGTVPDRLARRGNGIGLHMVKEYVTLHNGSINVESVEGKGSCFTVLLPLPPKQPATGDIPLGQAPLVLVVEDNEAFRTFLTDNLKKQFAVLEAGNGAEALSQMAQHTPDLILSDVMMPVMDGVDFCKKVKSNPDTQRIPIILISAKNSQGAQMEGYEAGADYYISKPFSMSLLLMHCQKCIEQYGLMKDLKGVAPQEKAVEIQLSEISVISENQVFMEKMIALVEAHMESPDFSVEALSSLMVMSRVNLYRKLMHITGKTPLEFIRLVRMKRAAQWLEKPQESIADIAYRVGFNNPKTFAKYFKETYGVLPSEYMKQHASQDKAEQTAWEPTVS